MKKWEAPFLWPETEASYFETERGLRGKNISAKMLWFKTLFEKEDVFLSMFVILEAPGNNGISVSVWLLSELLFVQMLLTGVGYNFLSPSHIPYEHRLFLGSSDFSFSMESECFELPTSY